MKKNKTIRKFRHFGNWYYKPLEFLEGDISIAIATAMNIESNLEIFDESTKKWEFVYQPWESLEINETNFTKYGLPVGANCNYKKCKYEYLIPRDMEDLWNEEKKLISLFWGN